jgi:hypothetical protein
MQGSIRAAHKSSWHVGLLLAATVAVGCLAELAVYALAVSFNLSQTVWVSLFMAVFGGFVLVAAHVLNANLPDDIEPADENLILRFRKSGFRHVALVICIAMFYPAGYALSHQFLHASFTESFFLGNLPCLAIGALWRRKWPITAGTPAETVRAHLLMVDRTRRAQSFAFAAFACTSLFAIMMMMPDSFALCTGRRCIWGNSMPSASLGSHPSSCCVHHGPGTRRAQWRGSWRMKRSHASGCWPIATVSSLWHSA